MDELSTKGASGVSLIERLSLYVIIATVFLLPIFFIPFQSTALAKGIIVYLGALVALFLYVTARLKEGNLFVPKSLLLASLWLLPLAYFLSALLTGDFSVSLFGQGIETDTFAFVAAGALLTTLTALLLRSRTHILRLYFAFLVSFLVVTVFEGMRLVGGPDFLSLGVFTETAATIVGRLNSLAAFYGLAAVLSLITLEGLQLNRLARVILFATLLVSLFFLIVVNFSIVWVSLAIVSLGLFVYSVFRNQLQRKVSNSDMKGKEPGISLVSLFVLVISLLFIFSGSTVGGWISNQFGVAAAEVRPSWQGTLMIARAVYNESPVFGSGPNTFLEQWAAHKPVEVNTTPLWNTDFSSAFGFVPTSFVTVGLLGMIAWLVFFSLFLYRGLRSLMNGSGDAFGYFLTLSSFLGSVYLWAVAIFYIPSAVILGLAFILTGVFIASLRFQAQPMREKEISFVSNPRIGFVSILLLTVLLLLNVAAVYSVGQRYLAGYLFQNALTKLSSAEITDEILGDALKDIDFALRFGNNARYYRTAAEVYLVRVNDILSQTGISEEEQRIQFQSAIGSAVTNAQQAKQLNEQDYRNWVTLARVYHTVVPLGIEGAYENAYKTYEGAIALNPKNPALQLSLARLELTKNKFDEAKLSIAKAVELKTDYTEAIYLLSQIQIAQGDLEEAIASVTSTVILEPSNPVVLFQLGLLQYNAGKHQEAIAALSRAIALNENYANARYFLGLAYYESNEKDLAIEQFQKVASLNPDNTEVPVIIENIQAGRAPFATNASVPAQDNWTAPPIVGE